MINRCKWLQTAYIRNGRGYAGYGGWRLRVSKPRGLGPTRAADGVVIDAGGTTRPLEFEEYIPGGRLRTRPMIDGWNGFSAHAATTRTTITTQLTSSTPIRTSSRPTMKTFGAVHGTKACWTAMSWTAATTPMIGYGQVSELPRRTVRRSSELYTRLHQFTCRRGFCRHLRRRGRHVRVSCRQLPPAWYHGGMATGDAHGCSLKGSLDIHAH